MIAAGVLAAGMIVAGAAADESAFERWVQPDSVDAIELLLAAPASRHPASLWGHVMLRVRYRADVPSPPGFAPVFQIGVEDAAKGDELAHTMRGVFGGLDAKLFVTPSHKVERRYRTVEARGLKVFELVLDAAERRRVLRRLWEASRDGETWGYAFFTDNCAGLLVELLGPAMGPELVVATPRFIRWPSSSLDLLARARRADGRAVLRYLGEEPGAVDRASHAEAAREEIAARLREAGAPVEGTASGVAQERASAYATLGEWALASPDDHHGRAAAAFLSESLDVELGEPRHRSNRASRGALVAALGDALAPLPAPPKRAPMLSRSTVATGASGGYTARIAGGAIGDRDARPPFRCERQRAACRGARPPFHCERQRAACRGARPFVEIDAAILEETLGDVRERGFRPDLGMRLLGARVRIERERITAHEWTVASLDSVRGGHGASFALRGWGDERRGIVASGFAEYGRAAGVAGDRGALSVRVAALGGAAALGGTDGVAPVVGARGRLATRLRAGATTLDRLEASLEGDALAAADDGMHGWIGRGELSFAKALGRRDRPSVVRFAIRASAGPGLGGDGEPEALALLEWQLP